MKKIFSVCFLLFISTIVFGQKTVNDVNAELRQVKGFHGVSISNAFEVILTQSNEEAVAVSAGDKEDNQYIRTEVQNGILKIWFDHNNKKEWGRNKELRAYISVKNISVLHASGATDIEIEGKLSADKLSIELSGASDLTGEIVVANELRTEISGASDMDITGSAKEVFIEASGASEFNAYEFTTSNCKIEASGASSVNITVEKELSAELSGASSVNYKGNASITHVRTSGASSVSKE
jgi:hypothetical protein